MTNLTYYNPALAEPPADLDARCPICHQLCDTLLYDQTGDIVGCDACTKDIDITDYAVALGEDYQTARCPVCGGLADTITTDHDGEALGCNECLSERDAYDYAVSEHNSYMEWLREMAQGGEHYGD